jgi:hypothetical protein
VTRKQYGPGIMEGLKGFQRDTVEYVFGRMYLDSNPVHRFLVADEVGLGKTMVARGVIAKMIDHQRARGVKRIDVVYICSSADIAQQNTEKLNVTGRPVFQRATRLTKLAGDLHDLKSGDINLVSLTPGTSFKLGDSAGHKDERALIYWLLVHAWGARRLRHPGVFRLLRAGAGQERWRDYVANFWLKKVGRGPGRIDRGIADKFKRSLEIREEKDRLAGTPTVRERFDEVADRLRTKDRTEELRRGRELVGEFRQILARSSVEALEPDLIILDEFQRFRHLLEDPIDEDDTRTLAQTLFNYESDDGHARTLLLSATPYKMYTLDGETDQDDHYQDFVKTTEFLLGYETKAFRDELRSYREAVLDLGTVTPETLVRRKRAVERRLKRVMTRTERLAATEDRSGMLEAKPILPGPITPADARTFMTFDQVSRTVGAADTVEYWKSAPYPLSFMDGYDVKRRLRDAASNPTMAEDLSRALKDADGLLDPRALDEYAALDPGNTRLRSIAAGVLDNRAWRLLWMPPSLPYYETPRSDFSSPRLRSFTKRLIFSSWQVVPQAVASVLSYEAERQMMQARDPRARNTAEARRKIRSLLQFRVVGGRPGSMSTFGLVNPSVALARLTDPLELAATLRARNAKPTADAVLAVAEERIARELHALRLAAPKDGAVDDDWYWAAPILLDRKLAPASLDAFFARRDRELARTWAPASDDKGAEGATNDEIAGLVAHLSHARDPVVGWVPPGRMPDDLESTLALVGIAGPANTALRALARGKTSAKDREDLRIRDAACRIAWGFRSLFGIPEVMALVRGRSGTEKAYWRRILAYCLEGNLQAVLDEYGHVLPEWLGHIRKEPVIRAQNVANGMYAALTIRAPLYGYDAIRATNGAVAIEPQRLRSRFALRFGVNATDEAGAVERAGQVRAAFNSPFWPFVLVTTSVGQEGLDFHQYCHAIVHWNLPANPVDFEQREGRVHRYKGHAVRRNVAEAHHTDALASRTRDPWTVLFEVASRSSRAKGKNDIVPFWIYEGSHHIERHVPMLPMSREIDQLTRLKKSLAVYRMVFGFPRQEDFAAWVAERLSDEQLVRYRELLWIDLSPPRARR